MKKLSIRSILILATALSLGISGCGKKDTSGEGATSVTDVKLSESSVQPPKDVLDFYQTLEKTKLSRVGDRTFVFIGGRIDELKNGKQYWHRSELSEADKLNGFTERYFVSQDYSLSRSFGTSGWDEWFDGYRPSRGVVSDFEISRKNGQLQIKDNDSDSNRALSPEELQKVSRH